MFPPIAGLHVSTGVPMDTTPSALLAISIVCYIKAVLLDLSASSGGIILHIGINSVSIEEVNSRSSILYCEPEMLVFIFCILSFISV